MVMSELRSMFRHIAQMSKKNPVAYMKSNFAVRDGSGRISVDDVWSLRDNYHVLQQERDLKKYCRNKRAMG